MIVDNGCSQLVVWMSKSHVIEYSNGIPRRPNSEVATSYGKKERRKEGKRG
jgi:hypothetical protein